MTSPAPSVKSNFIRDIIDADLAKGSIQSVVTRFPPEPNGYLHIGHAKAICLNFGLARDYGGRCHLRMDDTNPTTENVEYVENIQNDVRWLGFDWGQHMYYASDYFETFYSEAVKLINKGLAYVDSSSEEDIRKYRGSLSEPGTPSPFRDRSIDENLKLFGEMRAGKHADGSHVLRGKIGLAAANMKMRDPLLYRIRHAHHYRTGDTWCIYPMYDYAHPLSDALEGITHSICTLEFENNRELYDWVVSVCDTPAKPKQLEFARLNIGYTVMSKRKLLKLVNDKFVHGWDDPRMPTIAGMRRRGVPASALRKLADLVGIAKNNSLVDIGKFEFAVRDELNQNAPRYLGVLQPLPLILTNYPDDKTEVLSGPLFPTDIGKPGQRELPFSKTLMIDASDFSEKPSKDWKRLAPGLEVRLRHAYCVKLNEVVHDDQGNVRELRATYDEATLGRNPEGRKLSGTIGWVDAKSAVPANVHLYDRLFRSEKPDESEDFRTDMNPDSLRIVTTALLESAAAQLGPGTQIQLERIGYFARDVEAQRWNRIATLRDGSAEPQSLSPVDADKPAVAKVKNPKAQTRPDKASGAERRAAARVKDPMLAERYTTYLNQLRLSEHEADLLAGSFDVSSFFDAACSSSASPAALAKWMVNDLFGLMDDGSLRDGKLSSAAFAHLVGKVETGDVSHALGKNLLAEMWQTGEELAKLLEKKGVGGSAPVDLSTLAAKVVSAHDSEWQRLKSGKNALMGFFVGKMLKEAPGALPKDAEAAVRKLLSDQ